jgi:hypothetical protein
MAGAWVFAVVAAVLDDRAGADMTVGEETLSSLSRTSSRRDASDLALARMCACVHESLEAG